LPNEEREKAASKDWDKWMTGSFDDLLVFQARKFPGELIEMERTPELWV